ncbi:MAG: glycoside hydrolase family 16 protein [Oscillospiraceae bacterium]
MTVRRFLLPVLAAGIALSFCACSKKPVSQPESSDVISSEQQTTESTPAVTEPESEPIPDSPYLADLTHGYNEKVSAVFEMSDGWTNGSMFNCTWRKGNVTFNDGAMQLTIDTDAGALPYSGAEFRSKDWYGYGYYEVEMKPIKNDGVVSSFFTYTGPSDNNPWDEIDIEFLGKDTTKVQFNYFTNGKGGHEHIYDLGFDAAEEFHTYGFFWQADAITWYVDGEAVYTAEKNLPVTPSKIMANTWPGTGVDGWLNAYDGTTPITAEYRYIDFRPEP